MPIVSHTVKQTTQADGRISYELRLFTQEGEERGPYLFLLGPEINFQTVIDLRKVAADEQLAEDEFKALVGV